MAFVVLFLALVVFARSSGSDFLVEVVTELFGFVTFVELVKAFDVEFSFLVLKDVELLLSFLRLVSVRVVLEELSLVWFLEEVRLLLDLMVLVWFLEELRLVLGLINLVWFLVLDFFFKGCSYSSSNSNILLLLPLILLDNFCC